MQKRVVLRRLAAGEAAAMRRLAASRSEPAAVVGRTRMVPPRPAPARASAGDGTMFAHR